MLLSKYENGVVSLLSITLVLATVSYANPLPRVLLNSDFPTNHSLELRDSCGGVTCGWNGWLCCGSNQACSTSNNQALCVAAATPIAAGGGGSAQVYTTTYTDLTTVTTTYSAAATGTCALGQKQCTPSLCCGQDEWCNSGGPNGYVCSPNGAGGSSGAPATVPQASTISNFIAPTSVGVATVTSSMSVTTTIPFETPVGSSGSAITGQMVSTGGGLSAGAIAGIVIGVLAAIIILFLILACLCCRSIFDAIFGRKKKTTETTIIETHHSHHGSGAAPPPRRRFFGVLPARADRPAKKKSSGLGGLAAVGGFLAAAAILLGLRRRTKKQDEAKTEYSASDYTYSYDDYTTSASSASSDRRTRDSRRSRR